MANGPSSPDDLTPVSGAPTDVARSGTGLPKPLHERTAEEDREVADWPALAASPSFQALLRAKRRFIIPATIFFVAYFFALPVAAGYFPELMMRRVFGALNFAYLFALSQFFMAWILAALYVRAASRFDRMAEEVIAKRA